VGFDEDSIRRYIRAQAEQDKQQEQGRLLFDQA
jgi:hypothetical protein